VLTLWFSPLYEVMVIGAFQRAQLLCKTTFLMGLKPPQIHRRYLHFSSRKGPSGPSRH
jgi:hypothetical protein